jgi:hypothetical protein
LWKPSRVEMAMFCWRCLSKYASGGGAVCCVKMDPCVKMERSKRWRECAQAQSERVRDIKVTFRAGECGIRVTLRADACDVSVTLRESEHDIV